MNLISFQTFRHTEYVICIYISILSQSTKLVLKKSPHFSLFQYKGQISRAVLVHIN